MARYMVKKLLSGQNIPHIGLCTWMSNKKTELEHALLTAFESGYRFIDTAYAYQNETIIGSVLKHLISTERFKREEFFIATKLPMSGVHEERVGMFMKNSLDNLQLDYVNLYMIQFPVGTSITTPFTPLDQLKVDMSDHMAVWRKMEDQLEAGRTKAIGLCNFNQRQVERILKCCRIKPSCLQIELHVFLQQKELVEFCHKNNIEVIGYCPLGQPYNQFLGTIRNGPELHHAFEHPFITTIAEKLDKTPEQVILRFLIEKGVIPIPMNLSPNKIKQNINVFNFCFDDKDMEALESLDRGPEGRIVDGSFFPEPVRKSPEFPFPLKLASKQGYLSKVSAKS